MLGGDPRREAPSAGGQAGRRTRRGACAGLWRLACPGFQARGVFTSATEACRSRLPAESELHNQSESGAGKLPTSREAPNIQQKTRAAGHQNPSLAGFVPLCCTAAGGASSKIIGSGNGPLNAMMLGRTRTICARHCPIRCDRRSDPGAGLPAYLFSGSEQVPARSRQHPPPLPRSAKLRLISAIGSATRAAVPVLWTSRALKSTNSSRTILSSDWDGPNCLSRITAGMPLHPSPHPDHRPGC